MPTAKKPKKRTPKLVTGTWYMREHDSWFWGFVDEDEDIRDWVKSKRQAMLYPTEKLARGGGRTYAACEFRCRELSKRTKASKPRNR